MNHLRVDSLTRGSKWVGCGESGSERGRGKFGASEKFCLMHLLSDHCCCQSPDVCRESYQWQEPLIEVCYWPGDVGHCLSGRLYFKNMKDSKHIWAFDQNWRKYWIAQFEIASMWDQSCRQRSEHCFENSDLLWNWTNICGRSKLGWNSAKICGIVPDVASASYHREYWQRIFCGAKI